MEDFAISLGEFDKYIEDSGNDPYSDKDDLFEWLLQLGVDDEIKEFKKLVKKLENQGLVVDKKITVKGRLKLLQAVLEDLRLRENWDYSARKRKVLEKTVQVLQRDDHALIKYLLPSMLKPNAKM